MSLTIGQLTKLRTSGGGDCAAAMALVNKSAALYLVFFIVVMSEGAQEIDQVFTFLFCVANVETAIVKIDEVPQACGRAI